MGKTVKKSDGPSKSDLLRLVKEIGFHRPETLRLLIANREKAETALREFEENNEELKRLRYSLGIAANRLSIYRDKRTAELSKIRQLILLRGATPEVVRRISKLV